MNATVPWHSGLRYATFTSEQQTCLETHLLLALSATDVKPAMYIIANAFGWASADRGDPSWLADDRKNAHLFARSILSDATTLLERGRPHFVTTDDWNALGRIIATAREEIEATKPATRRGRKRLDWRDRLVSSVASVYPSDFAKSHRQHLVRTVEMLLGFLGESEIENPHEVIRKALDRYPEPPFVEKMKRFLKSDPPWERGHLRDVAI